MSHKSLYRFTSLLAAVAMFLGLMITGCGSEGDSDKNANVNYNTDKTNVIVRVGVTEAEAKGIYGPAEAVKYAVEMWGLETPEIHGFAAESALDEFFKQAYAEGDGFRTMRFTTTQVGEANFRIKYFDKDGNYLGSGYATTEVVSGENCVLDNTAEDADFNFVAAADEAKDASLVVTPTEVAVGEEIELVATYFYGENAYEEVEATYEMEENEFATLEGNVVTGVAAGTAAVTATYELAAGATVETEVSITVSGETPVEDSKLAVEFSGVETTFDKEAVTAVKIGEFETTPVDGGDFTWATEEAVEVAAYPVTFTVGEDEFTTTKDIDFTAIDPSEDLIIANITDADFEAVEEYTLAADFSAVTEAIFPIADVTAVTIGENETEIAENVATTKEAAEAGSYDVSFTVTGVEEPVVATGVEFAADAADEEGVITVALTDEDFEATGDTYTLAADFSAVTEAVFAIADVTEVTIGEKATEIAENVATTTEAVEAGDYDVSFTVTGVEEPVVASGVTFDAETAEEGVITVTLSDEDFEATGDTYTLVADYSAVTDAVFAIADVTAVKIGENTAEIADNKATVEDAEAGTYSVVFTVGEDEFTAADVEFSADAAEEGVITVALTDDNFTPAAETYTLIADFSGVSDTILTADVTAVTIGEAETTVDGTTATTNEAVEAGEYAVTFTLDGVDDPVVSNAVNFDAETAEDGKITVALTDENFGG